MAFILWFHRKKKKVLCAVFCCTSSERPASSSARSHPPESVRPTDPQSSPLSRIMWIIVALFLAAAGPDGSWGCQLPHDWRPQTEACRAELAEIIVFAKVLALHEETYSMYRFNDLPREHESNMFFSAEIELLCDQAWGSMLEVPAGSRFNVTGLGYFHCFSYTVTPNNNYYFFLRWEPVGHCIL